MHILFCEVEEWMKDYFTSRLSGFELEFTESKMQDVAAGSSAEIVSIFVNSRVDVELLKNFPNLKLLATRSTGFDHIDNDACKKKNITVCNVPSYGEHTVAEFTFALLLALSRKIYPALSRVHQQGTFHTEGLKGFDLFGKTIGVIGTGRIGCHVIDIANGFGMQVLAYDPYPKKEMEQTCHMKYVSLEELLSKSDVITIHTPYMPSTHHLLNSTNMRSIKKGAVLINTARGAIVDTMALVESLSSGVLSGAALDVLEEEGHVGEEWQFMHANHPKLAQMEALLADHQLLSLPNVLITPHNAFNTQEAMERILEVTIENIMHFQDGTPQNLIKA